MAPKKGTKRAQEAKGAAAAAKKLKVDAKYTPIIKGLQQADGLGMHCRQMLLTAVPHCLGTASDLRSDAQHVLVKMIGEALDEVALSLQQAVDVHTGKVQEADQSKATLKLKLAEAEEVLAKSSENVQLKKAAAEEKSRLLSEAKATLQEKAEAQHAGHAAFDNASSLKAALETAVQTDLKSIVAGEFTADDANAKYKSLEQFLNELKLDDSLKTAAPVTCVKPKDQRGAFDDLVIEQLEKAFSIKAAEFSGVLDDAAAKKAECDAAAEEAGSRVKDAEALSHSASADLNSAQASMDEASDAVKIAESNLAAQEVDRLSIAGELEAKVAVLSEFTVYNKGNFELLKDQISKADSAPQDHADMQNGDGSLEHVSILPAKTEAVPESGRNVQIEVGGA